MAHISVSICEMYSISRSKVRARHFTSAGVSPALNNGCARREFQIMTIKQQMETKIAAAFSPVRMEITDNSHQHAGHAEAGDAIETHFH
ncbi:MAG: BolA/IbaG family iron-sulfur metabolism protein, partial [Alphaproteobacteria bacterium]|nr:BolA/IbaG family iron-sulfur metabolism protein [Alphaproteobacteria bacterium]